MRKLDEGAPNFTAISVTYCCITNLKAQWLKKTDNIYYSFCGSGIWEWPTWVVLAWGFSWAYSKDASWGDGHLGDWLELEDSLPKWLTEKLMVVRKTQLMDTWPSSYNFLYALTVWHLASSDITDSRQKGVSWNGFYDLASKVIHRYFAIMIDPQTIPNIIWEGLPSGMTIRNQAIWPCISCTM